MRRDLQFWTHQPRRDWPDVFLIRLPLAAERGLWILGYTVSLLVVGLVSERHGQAIERMAHLHRDHTREAFRTAQEEHRYRLASADQAMKWSEPLCAALMGRDGWSDMTASAGQVKGTAGTELRDWEVECKGDGDLTQVLIFWDARTGELNSVSGQDYRSVSFQSGRLTSTQAQWQGWNLLHMLTKGLPSEPWQQAKAPQHIYGQWLFSYRSEGREARLNIADRTGNLLHFQQRPVIVEATATRPAAREPAKLAERRNP